MLDQLVIDTDFHLENIESNYQQLFRRALPFLETRKNKIHTYIAYQYALALLKHEPGEPEIAVPACILHDVGWSAVPEKDQLKAFGPNGKDKIIKRKHEVEGRVIAREILRDLDYEPHRVDSILNIIDGHDTTLHAKSPEDAIVKDADKLWRYTPEGLAIDINRFGETFEEGLARLEDHLGSWFLTASGRNMAAELLHQRRRDNR